MAGSLSPYAEKAVLDMLLGGVAFSVPATVYIEAYTVAPTDTTAGTPVSGGGYARLAVTNNLTNFPAATGQSPATKSNGTKLSWSPASGASWGLVTALAAFDAPTGGNRLMWGTVATSKQIDDADTLEIPIGGWTATLT